MGRERKDIERDETRDSVCPVPYIIGIGEGHGESKVEKAILTMKSLILAQDER